jgi:hypothetical protein
MLKALPATADAPDPITILISAVMRRIRTNRIIVKTQLVRDRWNIETTLIVYITSER